jgi:hypothetical protein
VRGYQAPQVSQRRFARAIVPNTRKPGVNIELLNCHSGDPYLHHRRVPTTRGLFKSGMVIRVGLTLRALLPVQLNQPTSPDRPGWFGFSTTARSIPGRKTVGAHATQGIAIDPSDSTSFEIGS